jgi:ABC-type phosphate transport system substrate-binding protein
MRLLVLKMLLTATVFFCVITSGIPAEAEEVHGSGSTFVFPIMSKWAEDYAAQGGDKITYQPIGSSGGIMQIKSGIVDFGASRSRTGAHPRSRRSTPVWRCQTRRSS